jgi:hypothetical protein
MATIDISILSSVSTVIVFMLVFVGSWGMMMLVDPFKDKGRSFYGIMAFLLAVLIVLSRKAVNVILIATPWLMILGLLGFFFLFFAKMFDGDVKIPIGKASVWGWVVFFVAIIFLFAIGNSFGQDLLSAQAPGQTTTTETTVVLEDGTVVNSGSAVASDDFGRNLTLTLFHPKILGVLPSPSCSCRAVAAATLSAGSAASRVTLERMLLRALLLRRARPCPACASYR